MSARTALLSASAFLAMAAPPAPAATPVAAKPPVPYEAKACAGDDRMLCVTYQPDRTLELDIVPGATATITLGPGETIVAVMVSDQRLLDSEDTAAAEQADEDARKKADPNVSPQEQARAVSCDMNICRANYGRVAYIKPQRDLAPQPLFIQSKFCDGGPNGCQDIIYPFVLVTKPADAKDGALHGTFGIHFLHPNRVTEAQRQAWLKRQQELAELRLMRPPPEPHPELTANWKYALQGNSEVLPNSVWDDGRNTLLFYSGNRRVPVPYERRPGDTQDTKIGFATEPGPSGTTLRIGKTSRKFCLRDGDKLVGCIYNEGPDPEGATAPTIAPALPSAPASRQAAR